MLITVNTVSNALFIIGLNSCEFHHFRNESHQIENETGMTSFNGAHVNFTKSVLLELLGPIN